MHDVAMTDAEKAALAAQQAADKVAADKKAADDAAAQDDDTQDDDAGAATDVDEESVQLKADLEKERKAREKAEKALASKAFTARKSKRDETATDDDAAAIDDDDASDDAPLTRKQLEATLARERENTRKETLANEAARLAQSMSTNETMQQLVLEKWKNRTFPTDLSLQDQIEECYLAANKKRIFGENNELKRALRGKNGTNKDSSGSHQDDSTSTKAPKLSSADAASIAQLGFKWNPTTNRHEKKLANGKLIVRDPKTKKTSLVNA